jgi:uncharacterized protein (TIRG00374 family)
LDSVADEFAVPAAGRNLKDLVRYALGVCAGIVVLWLLLRKRAELVAARDQLSHVDVGWVLAAVLAEALSLWTFAWLQYRVLRLSRASIPMPALTILTLANDAIANSVPGGSAVSSAFRYRFYRRHGVTGASAGWTIFTIFIAQAIGLSLLLLLGVVVALGWSTSGRNTGTAVAGLTLVIAACAVLVRRDLVLRLLGALVRATRRMTGHPRGAIGTRIEVTLARMREIPLSTRSTTGVVAIAVGVWFFDFLCLVCGFGAVHAAIPWSGVLLAYCVAQVVGALPVVPGGIGIVEGSLAVILVAYGADRVSAISAALTYRIVSFWLSLAVGWISFGVIARQVRRRSQRDGDQLPDTGLCAQRKGFAADDGSWTASPP